MGNEDLVLSEYLDGELPQDIARELEKRLANDKVLAARLETLRALVLPLPEESVPDFKAQAVRVWNRLEWVTRGKPRRSRVHRILDFFTRSISLPMPALAALAVVVMVLGGIAVIRSGGSLETGVAAMPAVNSEPVVFPSLSRQVSAAGLEEVSIGTQSLAAKEAENTSADVETHGLAVTFEVENLQELLRILEGREGIQELRITLPSNQTMTPLGEPVLMKASELSTEGGKP